MAERGVVNPSAALRASRGASSSSMFGGGVTDDFELATTRELRWPDSVQVYRRMARWGQVAAITQPYRRGVQARRWNVDPAGARDEVAQVVAEQLGLPIGDAVTPPQLGVGGFSWHEHLRLTLDAPFTYGHAVFETLFGPSSDARRSVLLGAQPRPQWTISAFQGNERGELESVWQRASKFGQPRVQIPGSEVLLYVWDQEPGSFLGVPLLRPLYGLWMCAERIMRINVVRIQRNAVGMPVAEYVGDDDPSKEDETEALSVIETIQASDTGGIVMPKGFKASLLGTTGGTVDPVASLRYIDEVMARVLSMQVVQLGSTQTGSRSLGDTFEDKAAGFEDSVCWTVARQSQPLIDRIVRENFGEDERSPVLAFPAANADPSFEELVALVDAGLVVPSDQLRQMVAKRIGLPAGEVDNVAGGRSYQYDLDYGILTVNERRAQIGLPPIDGGDALPESEQQRAAEPSPSDPLPPGGLNPPVVVARTHTHDHTHVRAATTVGHRQPSGVEVRAAVDFEAVSAAHDTGVSLVVEALKAAQAAAIDDIVGQLGKTKAAADAEQSMLQRIAGLTAPVVDTAAALAAMLRQAVTGAEQVAAEADAQGVSLPDVDLAGVDAALGARAELMSAMLGQALLAAAQEKAALMPAADAATVADAVRGHLEGLSDAYLEKKAQGAITASNGAGRAAQAQAGVDAGLLVQAYSSELLDSNTCENCAGVDGTEYATLAEVEADYPGGAGYRDCQGGERCRGMAVYVWASEQEAAR